MHEKSHEMLLSQNKLKFVGGNIKKFDLPLYGDCTQSKTCFEKKNCEEKEKKIYVIL